VLTINQNDPANRDLIEHSYGFADHSVRIVPATEAPAVKKLA
jgi:hypothetical protein